MLTAPIGPLGGTIQRVFGLTTAAMIATVVVPYVVATAALVAPGYLLGRRSPTATGVPALVFLILGSVVSLLAPGAALLAVGRVVVGLGAGTVVGVALALHDQLGRWRSQARLVLGIALGVALLLGPVVSGAVTVALGFRLSYVVDVLVAAVALAGTVVSGIALAVLSASRRSSPAAPATTTPDPDQWS
jgi:MFS family permease